MLNSFSRREAVLGAIASLFGAIWRRRSAGAGQSGRAGDAAALKPRRSISRLPTRRRRAPRIATTSTGDCCR